MHDRVSLRNMQFFAYHGVFGAERELGQRFELDVDLFVDVTEAAATDDLAKAVNYVEVHEVVKGIVLGEPFDLIEALAGTVAEAILEGFPVEGVTVRVRKPSVALGGILDGTEVELTRRRG